MGRYAPLATLATFAAVPSPSFAAFGVTSSGGCYIVDSGTGLVFKANQANGDIPSLKFNGVEVNRTSKSSQFASGRGTATVTATTSGR